MRRVTPAGAVAFLALALSLVTAAWALPNNSVFTEDIVDGEVRPADTADNSFSAANIAPNAVTSSKIAKDSLFGQDVAPDSVDARVVQDGSMTNEDVSVLPGGRATTATRLTAVGIDADFDQDPQKLLGFTVPEGDYVVVGDLTLQNPSEEQLDAACWIFADEEGQLDAPGNTLTELGNDYARDEMRVPLLGAFDLGGEGAVEFSIRCAANGNGNAEVKGIRLTAMQVGDVR